MEYQVIHRVFPAEVIVIIPPEKSFGWKEYHWPNPIIYEYRYHFGGLAYCSCSDEPHDQYAFVSPGEFVQCGYWRCMRCGSGHADYGIIIFDPVQVARWRGFDIVTESRPSLDEKIVTDSRSGVSKGIVTDRESERLCACGCGLSIIGNAKKRFFDDAHKMRFHRMNA